MGGDDGRVGDADVLRAAIRASLYPAPQVDREPVATMRPWRVLEISPAGTRHLCGRLSYEGRVSSAIAHYDPEACVATTRSGRVYRLLGPPGRDPDADWVWSGWAKVNGVLDWQDVSAEYSTER